MMFNYIASFLGFQGQGNSTNVSRDSYVTSCVYGHTIPDPAVRLRISSTDSAVRIFGHPPQEDYPEVMRYPPPTFGTDGPYVHYLYNPSKASLSYIMGDDWRSQLRSDHPPRPKALPYDGDVVLRPSVSKSDKGTCHFPPDDDLAAQTEERAHSLRMRRCGAVAICSESDMSRYESERADYVQDYLFGWPDGGGVWVLRAPWLSAETKPPVGARRPDEEIMESNLKRARERRVFRNIAKTLKQQEDMEDVCRVLEESGAQYHATIDDCPEAVELNLC
jgi:hypothetical protein